MAENRTTAFDGESKLEVYEQILENNWDAIVFANMEGTVTFANSAAYRLYGFEKKANELIGVHVDSFNSQKSHNTDKIVEAITTQGGWSGEIIQRRKDNSTFTALLTVSLIFGHDGQPIGFASHSKDITTTLDAQQKIANSAKENEVLLAEVHHRVKNNLQLISSILNLQTSFIEDRSVIENITSIQSRIRAMSLIHEKLYKQDVSNISFREYAENLFQNIVVATSIGDNIKCELDVDDTMLRIEKTLPLGLLLNELITNSLKHAFGDAEEGIVRIALRDNDGEITVNYSDNGSGFQEGTESYSESFGTLLIQTFAEQLDGELNFETSADGGTQYQLVFRV